MRIKNAHLSNRAAPLYPSPAAARRALACPFGVFPDGAVLRLERLLRAVFAVP